MKSPREQLAEALARAPSRRKFRNVPTEAGGLAFASKKEAKRFGELKALEGLHKIKGLRVQPVFPLVVNNFPVCKYIADFEYFEWDGAHVIEDVKSPATRKNPVYRLKVKLLYALTGMSVREV